MKNDSQFIKIGYLSLQTMLMLLFCQAPPLYGQWADTAHKYDSHYSWGLTGSSARARNFSTLKVGKNSVYTTISYSYHMGSAQFPETPLMLEYDKYSGITAPVSAIPVVQQAIGYHQPPPIFLGDYAMFHQSTPVSSIWSGDPAYAIRDLNTWTVNW